MSGIATLGLQHGDICSVIINTKEHAASVILNDHILVCGSIIYKYGGFLVGLLCRFLLHSQNFNNRL